MTAARLDQINIVLMLISAALAWVLPFELFLFVYAVLGPLHYLTEISWLHKRDYFTSGKLDFIWLGMLCAALFFLNFMAVGADQMVSNLLLFLAFASALAMVIFDNIIYKMLLVFAALVIGSTLYKLQGFFFLFGILLPTIIHVFLFTAVFILFGALKSKSSTGYLSVLVFVACTLAVLFFPGTPASGAPGEYVRNSMMSSGFLTLNQLLLILSGESNPDPQLLFQSNTGYAVMRFIAFAYTYHYLNWFSKTSVIKWHEVPLSRLAVVIGLWLLSVALYAWDYRTGLIALYFLSMLHVFLEFPLNFRSFIGIGKIMLGKPA